MEFKCPKCGYQLNGTPDECPLCHNKLTYRVGMESEAPPKEAKKVEESSKEEDAALLERKKEKAKIRKITAFNVIAIIYSLICLAFIAGVLLLPAFIMDDANTGLLPYGSNIPEGTIFTLLDYYVYTVMAFIGWLQLLMQTGGGFGDMFPIIFYVLLNAFEIFFLALAAIIAFSSLLCNIVNAARKKLPNYVKNSVVETRHDPLNAMGLIITFLIFIALDAFLTKPINELFVKLGINAQLSDAILTLKTPMFFLYFAAFGVVLVVAIVKGAMRVPVNPKVAPGERRY